MSCHKFIIGLGNSLPSTRVLKPPGGDCSDLFGLQSRQKALQKKTQGSICTESMKISQISAKVKSICNKTPSKYSESSISSTKGVKTMDALMESGSEFFDKDVSNSFISRSDINRKTDAVAEKRINSEAKSGVSNESLLETTLSDLEDSPSLLKVQSENHGVSDAESLSGNTESKDNSCVVSASEPCSAEIQSAFSGTLSFSKSGDNKTFNRFQQDSKKGPEKRGSPLLKTKHVTNNPKNILRNPITGEVMEVRSTDYYKTCKIVGDMQDNINVSFDISARNARKVSVTEDSVHSKVVPIRPMCRNPITGEHVEVDHISGRSENFVRSGVRIKQPPGGTSSIVL